MVAFFKLARLCRNVLVQFPNVETGCEGGTPPPPLFIGDVVSRPDLADLPEEEIVERVKAANHVLPYYFFCGFGFVNPTQRTEFGFHAT